MNSGRGSECVYIWLGDDIGGVMSVSSRSPLVLRSCFWLISSVSTLSCSTKCAVLISYCVHWMQSLSPISIKTMKMRTFSWGTFVDSVLEALLKVCEDEHGLYCDKNKQKLSICSPLTKLFLISTLCYFLLSNLPFSLFPVFFPWGINSSPLCQIIFIVSCNFLQLPFWNSSPDLQSQSRGPTPCGVISLNVSARR